MQKEILTNQLPDIASHRTELMETTLDWVGMNGIETPILMAGIQIPAKVSAFVSLDQTTARGIHMSRLYKVVQDQLSLQELSWPLLQQALESFLESHLMLSKSARLAIDFEAMVLRKALRSNNQAWRTYPVQIWAQNLEGDFQMGLEVLVTYSSTCPASAALARQLIQENFKKHFRGAGELDFKEIYDWLGTSQGISATPHAQRSTARVRVRVGSLGSKFDHHQLIDLIENALQTPVQALVKREDEQEFALRNGQNLMFCEDAARRLKAALLSLQEIADFSGEVRHVESLHPHDAVSFFSRG